HGWQGTVVWNMLTNDRYIGRATYSGVKVTIPPLVSEELFERVGAAMALHGNAVQSQRHGAIIAPWIESCA
ncbi:MAG: recombinase family protein, partial [Myxococcales bacterium]|nr:recombinase family protein [Myxococcales bacterium]